MQLTRYIRLLNNIKVIKLDSKFLHRQCRLTSANQINKVNKYVSLATNLTRTNVGVVECSHFNKKLYSTDTGLVDYVTYEKVCEETLESLCQYFEELVENCPHLESADVIYENGVLTVNFGSPYGIYVINRQAPNRQIWLSSPKTGPKRYDFVTNEQYWIYKHDNITLHELLQSEIKDIVKTKVDFSKCSYSFLRNSE